MSSDCIHIEHGFEPVYNSASSLLILGSFPSVKSREAAFYYGNPQNRFWRVISECLSSPKPVSIEDKKHLLLGHGIALWDVIRSCDITGSSDSSIKNVIAADIPSVITESCIKTVICNGSTSYSLYCRHVYPLTGIDAVKLPSTSPANASFSYEKLFCSWKSALSAAGLA